MKTKMYKRIFLWLGMMMVLAAVLVSRRAVSAQVIVPGWTNPLRVSSAEAVASQPFLFNDQFGNVHLFWSESGIDDRISLFYARYDGLQWSESVDIYISAPGAAITYIAPAAGPDGTMRLIWSEGENGPVFYSYASALDAVSARKWAKPLRLDLPATQMRMKIDNQGKFHVLLSSTGSTAAGVYYTSSEDDGFTWSEPEQLDPDIPRNFTPGVLQFEMSDNGTLHAAWYYLDLSLAVDPVGTWVRYTNSTDGGKTWSFPVTIDESDEDPEELRMAFPALAVQGDTVHIIWAGTSGTRREHRFSLDGGTTWSDTNQVFGELHGQVRGDGLTMDGQGRLHYMGNIRWPRAIQHAVWEEESRWGAIAPVYFIAGDGEKAPEGIISAHDVRLVARSENELVVTFGDTPGAEKRGLFVMQYTLPDTVEGDIAATPTPIPTATPEPYIPPTAIPVATPLPDFSGIPLGEAGVGLPIWLGVVPVFLLMGVVITVKQRRKR